MNLLLIDILKLAKASFIIKSMAEWICNFCGSVRFIKSNLEEINFNFFEKDDFMKKLLKMTVLHIIKAVKKNDKYHQISNKFKFNWVL